MKRLYLIPCPIAEDQTTATIPPGTIKVIHSLQHFVSERSKTARRFIKSTNPPFAIQDITVEEMNKHDGYDIPTIVNQWCAEGVTVGLLSEAGCPCVADPGFHVVRMFRSKGYKIIPLVGPVSMILALMASGLNGQAFTFHGYLPIDDGKKKNAIRKLEEDARKNNYSQIVIETPYRNQKLFQSFCKLLQLDTLLHISVDLTADSQFSETKSIKEWKKANLKLDKKPAVFIIGK